MERQEILAKAQQENKGRDFEELEAQKKATNVAFTVGGFAIIAVVITELIVFKKFNYGVMAGIFVMLFSAFLTKYMVRKKKHELFVTICYGAMAIAFLTLWILTLCKVI